MMLIDILAAVWDGLVLSFGLSVKKKIPVEERFNQELYIIALMKVSFFSGILFKQIFQEFRRKLLSQIKTRNHEMFRDFSRSYYDSGEY